MPKVLSVYLQLSEYPILARMIREQMREELFARGVMTREQFDQEVRAKAIASQEKEGLSDPFAQESPQEWADRVRIIRDHLTDFYFALNLSHERFDDIVRSTLSTRQPEDEIVLTFNPELAPWDMLFAQAEEYEKLPPEKKVRVAHHMQEIKIVLVRGMISDQINFVGVAGEHFDIFDLKEIRSRRIGRGKIGGKAAGMMLAYKILQEDAASDAVSISQHVAIPESYFLGADVFYEYMSHNHLFRFSDQKYKPREEIEADYPEIYRHFCRGEFPEYVVDALREVVDRVRPSPLIVRSSSLLEDSFGTSFAGKYDSFFCPNQSTPEENLRDLLDKIRRVYASILHADALFYRQQMGLVHYDERMAVLIQRVQGARYKDYYLPAVAGVAFGRNPFRWSRKIRREDGFLRLVWGLGTRAVDRVAEDYPRMVALSHPTLRPEVTAAEIKKYSQRFVDVINLADNQFETMTVTDVIGADYPGIDRLISVDEGDYLSTLTFRPAHLPPGKIVLTFDKLLKDQTFIDLMRAILQKLEAAYGRPVDVEFTVEILPGPPHFVIHLLQCRPLSRRESELVHALPQYVAAEDVIFTASRLIPDGIVQRIEYVIYVDPSQYAAIPDYATRHEIGRIVGRLNKVLEGHRFILIGPGRWGSSHIELGVKVSYADIYNTSMLIEVAFSGPRGTPELSYGTHFFQDLVEAHIYPLALFPEEEVFNAAFFAQSDNLLPALLPPDEQYAACVKVVDVPASSGGRMLEVVMNAEEDRALGYLRRY
jgi:hypothetical protein